MMKISGSSQAGNHWVAGIFRREVRSQPCQRRRRIERPVTEARVGHALACPPGGGPAVPRACRPPRARGARPDKLKHVLQRGVTGQNEHLAPECLVVIAAHWLKRLECSRSGLPPKGYLPVAARRAPALQYVALPRAWLSESSVTAPGVHSDSWPVTSRNGRLWWGGPPGPHGSLDPFSSQTVRPLPHPRKPAGGPAADGGVRPTTSVTGRSIRRRRWQG
jgi:hypothetical protein